MATRGSTKWRTKEWGPPCKPQQSVKVPIYAGGPGAWIDVRIRTPYIMLGQVFLRHSYIVRRIGAYNCRQITGGTSYSSHAWGISVDVNDDTNPYRRDRLVTDMSPAMIRDTYQIKTIDGVQVWRNGGDWDGRPETPHSNYDAMHFECIATPRELAVGFEMQPGIPTRPVTFPTIRRGAIGPAVVTLQRLLGMVNLGAGAGQFGPRTELYVTTYQKSRGLEADGIAGAATWTALLTKQPPLTRVGIPPQKPKPPNVA